MVDVFTRRLQEDGYILKVNKGILLLEGGQYNVYGMMKVGGAIHYSG